MPDPFDAMFGKALAPPDRPPDRAFTTLVQARVRLEEKLIAQRRAALAEIGVQALALLAFAAGLLWLVRAEFVADFFQRANAPALALVLAAFGALTALLLVRPGPAVRLRGQAARRRKLNSQLRFAGLILLNER